MVKILFLFFIAAITLTSCDEDSLILKGTVKYLDIEGGFYGISGDDGNNYDPMNLPEEFKKDGIKVEFEYKKKEDLSSFHMWGKIIEIIKIRKIE